MLRKENGWLKCREFEPIYNQIEFSNKGYKRQQSRIQFWVKVKFRLKETKIDKFQVSAVNSRTKWSTESQNGDSETVWAFV